jgi:hypothetical protein
LYRLWSLVNKFPFHGNKSFYVVVLKRFIGVYIIPVFAISPLATYQAEDNGEAMQHPFRSFEMAEWGKGAIVICMHKK